MPTAAKIGASDGPGMWMPGRGLRIDALDTATSRGRGHQPAERPDETDRDQDDRADGQGERHEHAPVRDHDLGEQVEDAVPDLFQHGSAGSGRASANDPGHSFDDPATRT